MNLQSYFFHFSLKKAKTKTARIRLRKENKSSFLVFMFVAALMKNCTIISALQNRWSSNKSINVDEGDYGEVRMLRHLKSNLGF